MLLTPTLHSNFSVRWRCQLQAENQQLLDQRYVPLSCLGQSSSQPRRLDGGFE
jgi:hypothetical protein